MNTRSCLKIADRMSALLQQELGQGVDGLRMVAEPLYARDVLLVCDAMPGTELPTLAQHFRVAANERPEDADNAAAPSQPSPAGRRSGFVRSIGARVSSGFGLSGAATDSSVEPQTGADAETGPSARRWFSPSRWLNGK